MKRLRGWFHGAVGGAGLTLLYLGALLVLVIYLVVILIVKGINLFLPAGKKINLGCLFDPIYDYEYL